jgi:hypothetical protein
MNEIAVVRLTRHGLEVDLCGWHQTINAPPSLRVPFFGHDSYK